ncbi:hypothetical protein SAMN04488601_10462 [Paenibacillus sp. 453mf]|nr:hypothetical protein SAMN04488601_10462 [Paenibacillus sp. 453mf]
MNIVSSEVWKQGTGNEVVRRQEKGWTLSLRGA